MNTNDYTLQEAHELVLEEARQLEKFRYNATIREYNVNLPHCNTCKCEPIPPEE